MRRLLLLGALFAALAFEACAHAQGSRFDLKNPPDAGPELRWG